MHNAHIDGVEENLAQQQGLIVIGIIKFGFAVHVVITGQVAEGGVVVGYKEGVAGIGEHIGGEDVGIFVNYWIKA